jgi:hypothetical protein
MQSYRPEMGWVVLDAHVHLHRPVADAQRFLAGFPWVPSGKCTTVRSISTSRFIDSHGCDAATGRVSVEMTLFATAVSTSPNHFSGASEGGALCLVGRRRSTKRLARLSDIKGARYCLTTLMKWRVLTDVRHAFECLMP